LSVVIYAHGGEKPAIVSGKWTKILLDKVNLYKMMNGELEEIASFNVGEDRLFYFACKPSSQGDIYFVGVDKSPRNLYAIYLKEEDRIDLSISENSYQLDGNANSAENKELEKWYNFMQPLKQKAFDSPKGKSTYKDFFPLLTEKLAVLETYPKNGTGNKHFNDLFEDYKRIDFPYTALSYLSVPRLESPQASDFPDYYRKLEISDFTQTAILMDYPSGLDVIEKIAVVKAWSKNEPFVNLMDDFLKNPDMIPGDTIKGELFLRHVKTKRKYADVIDFQDKYGKYLVTRKQQVGVLKMMALLGEIKEGVAATEFRFPDNNDKEVALSDFKGKVVYIDVWATWCGPCKKEIPHLKTLEKEYHGNKDIVFLSISIDAQKDWKKWKDFIIKEDLKGIQLFAGDRAQKDLKTPYRIIGIPRFILIGKDGSIISSDAPRPSSSAIRPVLESLLK
jgi:thiol-disulfide isomerase/thioredoxin